MLIDRTHLVIAGILLGVTFVLTAVALLFRQRRVVHQATRGLALLVEHAADPVVIVGTLGDIRYLNPAARSVFGFEDAEVPASVLGLLDPRDIEEVAGRMDAAIAGDPLPGVIERRVRTSDGRWLICESVTTNLLHHPGVEGLVVTLRDITARRAAEVEAAAEHALTEAILATTTALVVTMDTDLRIQTMNRAAEVLTGYTAEEVRGTPVTRFVAEEDPIPQATAIATALATTGTATVPATTENHWVGRDGQRRRMAWNNVAIHDEHGRLARIVSTGIDVTAERRAQRLAQTAERREHDRLAHEATHDGLTGVLNRAGLLNELDHLLRQARPGASMAVLFLDLDDFKVINDTHGHQVGDQVLRVVAERIVEAVRGSDVVGRLGGDEFVVLCPGLCEELASSTAARIGAAIDRPITVEGRELHCGVSAGAVAATDGKADALLTAADAAMYEVKRTRREHSRRLTGDVTGSDPDDSRRLELLRRLGLFDTEGQADPFVDTIVKLAAELCDVPMAALSLIDADRQFFRSSVGIDVSETPRSASFCAHAIRRPDEVMVVADARADGRFRSNPLVTDEGVRYYAGAPLTIDGTAIGALCVVDRSERALTAYQLATLERLRDSLVTYLELTAPDGVPA